MHGERMNGLTDVCPRRRFVVGERVGPHSEVTMQLRDLALVGASLLFSLVFIEVGYRIAAGLPVFKFADWRVDRVVMDRLGEFKAIPDPVLGWTSKSWNRHEHGYTTIEHGIRQNFGETTVRTGAVLAVGDSFTEGWEVKDHESWPAYLEKRIGMPVVNAGIGAYGTDQIVLRAEQLLPIVRPKILIVGFLEEDIIRAGHSIFGAPKPYFTLENGALRYHPPEPLEPRRPSSQLASLAFKARDVLAYSAAADYVLARLNPNYWYSAGARDEYRKVDIDPAEITCALLRRLKAQTDRDGIRVLLFMQHHAPQIIDADRPSANARRVVACAAAAGIRAVDQFASLRAIERARPNSMPEYYVHGGDLFGHMTAKGNEHAAKLLALALADWLPAAAGSSPAAATPPPRAADGTRGAKP
jgi:hypothetical protein